MLYAKYMIRFYTFRPLYYLYLLGRVVEVVSVSSVVSEDSVRQPPASHQIVLESDP
jgi:hypothetical protein